MAPPGGGIKRTADQAFHTRLDSFRKTQTGPNTAHGKVVNFESAPNGSGDYRNGSDDPATNNPNQGPSLKARAQQLQASRNKLPIFSHAEQIRQKLREHDVLLLVGETGSGKSTQIPQYLVGESWCEKQKIKAGTNRGANVGGCIAITQPRRVAAISLARRVAAEMGTPLGNASPASLVGYSVRFQHNTSPSTRIKFLTDGTLLQEMLKDPWLREYSSVIVDEVHERGVNVDLVLGFLKRMQDLRHKTDGRGGVPLKIVIMSATADMEKIKDFFNTKPKQGQHPKPPIEEEEEWQGFPDGDSAVAEAVATEKPVAASLFIKGRQYPVTINYTPTSVPNMVDAAYERIISIHRYNPLPGDVLVFLTGQEAVESLLGLLSSWSASIQKDPTQSKELPKLLLLPLYAALSSDLQQRVFQRTPPFTRKIILATNIAEASITVPGVKYVVDTGKAKQRIFFPSLNFDTLRTVPISRSSANQRAGRAGRDGPGFAYRLYTEPTFLKLAQDTEPEILRCDLSQLALTLKAHSIEKLGNFPFLTLPTRRALSRAREHLNGLLALDRQTPYGDITKLGRDMSLLPLPPSLARALLASAEPEYACVDEMVDIVSALSGESIFLNISRGRTEEPDSDVEAASRESLAEQARRPLFRREGDHLTLLATMQAYSAENTDRRRWCEERYISHRAMRSAMDVKKQLTAWMGRYMTRAESAMQSETPAHDRTTLTSRILKCLLTGFHPNVAGLCPDGRYRLLVTDEPVTIHPSSVLFSRHARAGEDGEAGDGGHAPRRRRFPAIVCHEFVYADNKPQAQARGVSMMELRWFTEYLQSITD